MAATALSRFGRFALDLLYPPSCALCRRHGSAFCCADCEASLPRALGPRCPECWLPLSGRECRHCQAYPPILAALRSPYRYEGPARDLVHRFKFGDLSSLSEVMVPAMATMVDWEVDAVVPVPLAGGRQRQRGYNQALLLARCVATTLGVPAAEALKRVKTAPPQARSTAEERRRNVEGAFAMRDAASVRGRRVLLVDDVATTGATLRACARALLDGEADEVRAVTFARED